MVSLAASAKNWVKITIAIVILLAVIPISSVYRIHIVLNGLTKKNYQNPLHANDIYYKNYHENFEIIKQLNCPLFVFYIPLLNAKLLLKQEDNSFPVSAVFLTRAEIQDSNERHLFVSNPGKPAGHIIPEKEWPYNHQLSFLYNPITKEVNREWVDYLVEHFGRIAIYLNLGDIHEFKPVLEYAEERGFEINEISRLSWIKLVCDF